MKFHRPVGDAEFQGNLLVAPALQQKQDDVLFAFAEWMVFRMHALDYKVNTRGKKTEDRGRWTEASLLEAIKTELQAGKSAKEIPAEYPNSDNLQLVSPTFLDRFQILP